MRRLLVAGLVALAFGTAQGEAASFDCRKASSTHETLVCGDRELSAADDRVAAAYKTALGAVSDASRALLVKGQRSWLTFIKTVCRLDGSADSDEDAVACLKREYDDRERQLDTAAQRLGGLVFVRVDDFRARKSDDNTGNRTGFVTTELAFPLIDRPVTDGQRAFNKFVEDRTRRRGAAPPPDDDNTDTATDYRILGASPELVSVEFGTSEYGHGAAHPDAFLSTVLWLLKAGRELRAGDLFDAAKPWSPAVARLCRDALAETAKRDDLDLRIPAPQELAKMVAEIRRWSLEPEGLGVQFQVYELGSRIQGAPQAVIPWHDLKPWLAAKPAITIPPREGQK